ncbi:MAG: protein phosphatase 2C domain-containing protein [Clostridiaceae bacterium]|nr:protein phosphatase 2C domain-containing protein [Clostridiaceae bacterium]
MKINKKNGDLDPTPPEEQIRNVVKTYNNDDIFAACKKGPRKKICQDAVGMAAWIKKGDSAEAKILGHNFGAGLYPFHPKIEGGVDGVRVAVVADGHGNALYHPYSDIGAFLACRVVLKVFAESYKESDEQWFLASKFKKEIVKRWRHHILYEVLHSKNLQIDSSLSEDEIMLKFGTTVLFALVDRERIFVGQIGDGAILLFNSEADSEVFKMSDPKLSSATDSLCDPLAADYIFTGVYKKKQYSHVLLATDGPYDVFEGDEQNKYFARYAAELLQNLNEETPEDFQKRLDEFCYQDGHLCQETLDDCSIALIVTDTDKNNPSKIDTLTAQLNETKSVLQSTEKSETESTSQLSEQLQTVSVFRKMPRISLYKTDESDKLRVFVDSPDTNEQSEQTDNSVNKICASLEDVKPLFKDGDGLYEIEDGFQLLDYYRHTNSFPPELASRFAGNLKQLTDQFDVHGLHTTKAFWQALLVNSKGGIRFFGDLIEASKGGKVAASKELDSFLSTLGLVRVCKVTRKFIAGASESDKNKAISDDGEQAAPSSKTITVDEKCYEPLYLYSKRNVSLDLSKVFDDNIFGHIINCALFFNNSRWGLTNTGDSTWAMFELDKGAESESEKEVSVPKGKAMQITDGRHIEVQSINFNKGKYKIGFQEVVE